MKLTEEMKLPKIKMPGKLNLIISLTWAIIFIVGAIMGVTTLRLIQQHNISSGSVNTYSIGQEIINNSFSVKVNSIRIDTKGDGFFKPQAGDQFIIVNLTFTNLSSKALPILPSLQTSIKDETGTAYMMSPLTTTEGVVAGNLLPHDKITGDLSYEVPSKAKNLTFYVNIGGQDPNPVAIKLKP